MLDSGSGHLDAKIRSQSLFCDLYDVQMQSDNLTRALLIVAVVLLGANLVRSFVYPPSAHAQPAVAGYAVYVEPGVRMLRAPDGSKQLLGKVFIDLNNGNVWGYPTFTEQPYPVDVMATKPPTSRPFLLGKFDLSAMTAQQ